MIDFKNMVKALKIGWVKRLLCPNHGNCIPKWKILTLKMSGMTDISKFTCKLSLNQIPRNIPKFHKQILECWFDFFSGEPSSKGEILNEKLVLNRFISIQGQPISENFALIRSTGITNVGQLVTENAFKTLAELEQEYHCRLSQLQLNSLVSAIPSAWKKTLKHDTTPATNPLYDIPHLKINFPKLDNKKYMRL